MKLTATPELRALLDAWLAMFAAPGMCNPDSGDAERDVRGHGQRQHDTLAELVRGRLGDPKLGKHNGLPVTVIADGPHAGIVAPAPIAPSSSRESCNPKYLRR